MLQAKFYNGIFQNFPFSYTHILSIFVQIFLLYKN